jgi:hypothetical protein
MCVIIDRQPGVTVPFDKLETACRINPNGYGIAYAHRGRLKVETVVQQNDPREIQDKLERLKKHRVFLHLRYSTVGAVNADNAHPFFALKHKTDGMDMAFMHNGTLGSYHPTGEALKDGWSDTRFFNVMFVKPLAERCQYFLGNKSVLEDPFFRRAIAKETGPTSVIVLFDAHGNVLYVNGERGQQYEGWWASNTYSFLTTHTRHSGSNYSHGAAWVWPGEDNEPYVPFNQRHGVAKLPTVTRSSITLMDIASWEDDLKAYDAAADKAAKLLEQQLDRIRNLPYSVLTEQIDAVKQYLTTAMLDQPENSMGKILEDLHATRPSLSKELEINDITDFLKLPEEHFVLLCKTAPAAMAQAFVELCGKLDQARKAAAVSTARGNTNAS